MNKNYFSPNALASVFALIIMIATAVALVYVFFVEKPSLRYMNLPFPVLKGPVYSGDTLPLKVSRCSDAKDRRVITSSRFLENIGDDQEVLVMEIIAALVPPGCVTQRVNIHRVPESTQPGQYRIIGLATVPGLIRDFKVEWHSAPFNVVARPAVIQPLKTPP